MLSENEQNTGLDTGTLLECPLCGNPKAVRTRPKLGDREAFSCPECGDLDLAGNQIAELKAKKIADALAPFMADLSPHDDQHNTASKLD